MWVTGNPSQMSLPYFKTVSTLLSKAERITAHSTPTNSSLNTKPQNNSQAIYVSLPKISDIPHLDQVHKPVGASHRTVARIQYININLYSLYIYDHLCL